MVGRRPVDGPDSAGAHRRTSGTTAPAGGDGSERSRAGPEPRRRLFGGKHELEEEVTRLNAVIDALGVNQRAALQAEIVHPNVEVPQLRQEEATLQASVIPLRNQLRLPAERLRSRRRYGPRWRNSVANGMASWPRPPSSEPCTEEIPKLQAQY